MTKSECISYDMLPCKYPDTKEKFTTDYQLLE